jgi:prolyl 4-hydroxylase
MKGAKALLQKLKKRNVPAAVAIVAAGILIVVLLVLSQTIKGPERISASGAGGLIGAGGLNSSNGAGSSKASGADGAIGAVGAVGAVQAQVQAPQAQVPYAPVHVPRCIEPEECDRLIARASKSLVRSKTLGDVVSSVRTSEQAWVDPNDAEVGDIVRKIRTRTGQMTGIYREDLFEQLQVARYNQTQEYKQHYDACVEQCDRDKRERIPRRATMLVYLTDDFEDGYTHFPNINERVRPRRGDAVLFYNSDADTGAEIPDSLHAGEPVTSGTKWIANCWVRYDQSAKRV